MKLISNNAINHSAVSYRAISIYFRYIGILVNSKLDNDTRSRKTMVDFRALILAMVDRTYFAHSVLGRMCRQHRSHCPSLILRPYVFMCWSVRARSSHFCWISIANFSYYSFPIVSLGSLFGGL
ncbi:hypothetical protein RvY_14600 [Ramazzottius varieornatus]|uniref:Uncharacterized protein n=1 Tax=Ramazzottius varieornatus TaxID=947166 RepID=A0A1D1VRV1_RAMVA|nr:hypothetical protein RvY_14600 [Ramazzottius varieornatus]